VTPLRHRSMLDWRCVTLADAGCPQPLNPKVRSGPWETETVETYTDGPAMLPHPEYNWPWTVGGLVTVLINAGLRIERLRELPIDVRQRVPSMVRSDDGFWHLPGDPLPLMVSCVATRPL
jgi:hypothetical protein